jgi:DNA-binding IscR family transcriptional regulator
VRISAKGEYAIKAMVDLALHDGPELQPIQTSRRASPSRRGT